MGSPRGDGLDLDHDRIALAAARADRGDAEAAAAAAQLVDEGADDPGAGGADRMAECDRAAIDVDRVLVDLSIRTELIATEAKASLISQRSTSAGVLPIFSRACRSLCRGPGQVGEVIGDRAVGDDRRQRL